MNNIQPLDLLFFMPDDCPISNIIGKVQKITLGKGDWSHVGIVVNKYILPRCADYSDDPNELFIWESTINERKIGVQLNKVSNFLGKGKYSGRIGHARLLENPAALRKDEKLTDYYERITSTRVIVSNLYNRTIGISYACGLCNLLGSAFTFIRPFREFTFKTPFLKKISGKNWIFCSELACMLYHELGIIDKNVKARDTVPMDFLGFDKDGMKKHFSTPIIIQDSNNEKLLLL